MLGMLVPDRPERTELEVPLPELQEYDVLEAAADIPVALAPKGVAQASISEVVLLLRLKEALALDVPARHRVDDEGRFEILMVIIDSLDPEGAPFLFQEVRDAPCGKDIPRVVREEEEKRAKEGYVADAVAHHHIPEKHAIDERGEILLNCVFFEPDPVDAGKTAEAQVPREEGRRVRAAFPEVAILCETQRRDGELNILPSLEERLRESAFRFANTGRNAFSCHQCTGLGSKDFMGSVHFSADDEVFSGKIEGIEDLVSFEGKSVKEIKKAFEEAVDDHARICQDNNKELEKSHKGSFNVRMPPDLHRRAKRTAVKPGISLNQFAQKAVEDGLEKAEMPNWGCPATDPGAEIQNTTFTIANFRNNVDRVRAKKQLKRIRNGMEKLLHAEKGMPDQGSWNTRPEFFVLRMETHTETSRGVLPAARASASRFWSSAQSQAAIVSLMFSMASCSSLPCETQPGSAGLEACSSATLPHHT